MSITFSLSDDRDTMTFNVAGEGDFTLNRVESVYGEIQGAWLQDEPENAPPGTEDEAVLFIFTDDKYIGFQPFEENNEIGLEYGTYTYDPDTDNLQLTVAVDTSQDSLTSGITINSASVDKNILTINASPDEAPESFDFQFRRR